MMENTLNRQEQVFNILKWTCLFMFLTASCLSLMSFHQHHGQKLQTESELLRQKHFLVTQMHHDMLHISRAQLELLHASNEQQVKTKLSQLSTLISGHLVNYYHFKSLADDSDVELLNKFKGGFEKWQVFNEDLLSYANSISDTGFINTLKKVDMAINQLEEDSENALLLISQIQKSESNFN